MQNIREDGFFMRYEKHLHSWETAALLSLCAFLCVGVWAGGRQVELSRNLIRLHVLAHSDAPEEQALKLRVRDAVLECLAPQLEGVQSADEAQRRIESALPMVQRAAETAAEGRAVRVTLDSERYPSRRYEGFVLPAGRYRSLRVVLGAGEGHNWWCIVFPPVCLAAVQAEELRSVMNPDDYALLTGEEGWELRLRSVELWGELVNFLSARSRAGDSGRDGSSPAAAAVAAGSPVPAGEAEGPAPAAESPAAEAAGDANPPRAARQIQSAPVRGMDCGS